MHMWPGTQKDSLNTGTWMTQRSCKGAGIPMLSAGAAPCAYVLSCPWKIITTPLAGICEGLRE